MDIGSINIGFSGRQNLEVLKKGKLVKETGFHKNLVLNSFFGGIVSGNFGLYGQNAVGTGTAAPAPEQVNLSNFLAGKAGPDSATSTLHSTDATHYTFRHRRVWTYPEGAVVGNISEIATSFVSSGSMPSASTTMNTRALVLDQANQPTTISVAADEQLRVTHDLFVRVPKSANVFNFSVTTQGSTTNHTATSQFIRANDNTSLLGWLFYGNSSVQFRLNSAAGIFSFNANNSGTTEQNAVSASGHSSIVVTLPSATVIRTVLTFPSTELNPAGGIEGITIGLFSPFGVKFAPKLPKNNLNKLTLSYEIAFTRI